ncbi:MAG: ABC transporter ATP-binding protein [Clostridiales bacterium]|nr:ABC transporter ATP-binding protein [Clostridiales bacterium]
MSDGLMLEIRDLQISFNNRFHDEVVRGIDLSMGEGEMLGLVGESGSGKTITALTIAGLIRRDEMDVSGEINFCGQNLLTCPREVLRQIQGQDIGFVFQEPMTSLNPLMRVGRQIEESLKLHTDLSRDRRRELALEAIQMVGLPDPEAAYQKYPHQMSGGQRQRAIIASAFINHPKLLIADEPTTALDVTVQAQIIELLKEINLSHGVAILFISHDLNVVRKLCENVAVMQHGYIVERGNTDEVFLRPQHAYTQRLIAAIPAREKRKR